MVTETGEVDGRSYDHAVRVPLVEVGSGPAQDRSAFYPDNQLCWDNNRRARHLATGWAVYTFPDQAVARKFAERFDGVYLGKQ